jgi:lipid-A-disaccharide synthase
MNIFLICGETSGDQHAADIIRACNSIQSELTFVGMGGEECQKAGMNLLLHQKEMAFMGFWEVIKNLRTIRKKIVFIKKEIIKTQPKAILLIDYAGFNLRIAKFAKSLQIPVHFYIAPKTWAWKESRVKTIQKYVDYLYCILPFETSYFQKFRIKASYVGNPSKEQFSRFQVNDHFLSIHKIDKPIVALLPGSRTQEIKTALPIMLQVAKNFPKYQFVIAQAPGFETSFYQNIENNIKLVKEDMHNLLHHSNAAIVTSGTATLETALHNIPQVVCYKTSTLTYKIAKILVRLNYISLVNLILNKEVIKEFIQDDFNEKNITKELTALLYDEKYLAEIRNNYFHLNQLLGDSKPSHKVASALIESFEKQNQQ